MLKSFDSVLTQTLDLTRRERMKRRPQGGFGGPISPEGIETDGLLPQIPKQLGICLLPAAYGLPPSAHAYCRFQRCRWKR